MKEIMYSEDPSFADIVAATRWRALRRVLDGIGCDFVYQGRFHPVGKMEAKVNTSRNW